MTDSINCQSCIDLKEQIQKALEELVNGFPMTAQSHLEYALTIPEGEKQQ